MQTTLAYRTLLPTDWEIYRALRLAALQESPNAFGSTLAAEQLQPAEQWQDRLTTAQASKVDLALMALVDSAPAGLAWGQADAKDSETVNIFQMWVAPQYRNLGIGKGLLEQIISWARNNNAKTVQLAAVCGDTPAMRLYSSMGFLPTGSPEPLREHSALLSQNMILRLDEDNPHEK